LSGEDTEAGEIPEMNPDAVIEMNAHGVITFAHSTTQKYSKSRGFMKILNYLFLSGRKSYTCPGGAAKSGL